MNRELSLQEIFSTIILLFGNSGAGKGVAVEEIAKECTMKDIILRGYASGDGFRALFSLKDSSDDQKEALMLMDKGIQVEGIYPIEDTAVARIKEHLIALQRGEKSLLYLDGMWRNGEDESQITKGKRLPSQGLQLAGMFLRAIKELQEEGTLKLRDEDAYLIGITAEQDLKTIDKDGMAISSIYELLRRDSNHIVVHVDNETAGTLMRVRSYLELRKVFNSLATNTTEDIKKDKTLEAVIELMLIQSGNFDIKNNKIHLNFKEISSEVKLFENFKDGIDNLVDSKVLEVCTKGLVGIIGEDEFKMVSQDKIIKNFIKEVKTRFGIKTDWRADDMTIEVTEKRRDEFEGKVAGHVYPELGIKIVNDENGKPVLIREGIATNIHFLVNEIDHLNPRRGFERYIARAGKEAHSFFKRLGYENETIHEIRERRRY